MNLKNVEDFEYVVGNLLTTYTKTSHQITERENNIKLLISQHVVVYSSDLHDFVIHLIDPQ